MPGSSYSRLWERAIITANTEFTLQWEGDRLLTNMKYSKLDSDEPYVEQLSKKGD